LHGLLELGCCLWTLGRGCGPGGICWSCNRCCQMRLISSTTTSRVRAGRKVLEGLPSGSPLSREPKRVRGNSGR
jgi:hypothetical protein